MDTFAKKIVSRYFTHCFHVITYLDCVHIFSSLIFSTIFFSFLNSFAFGFQLFFGFPQLDHFSSTFHQFTLLRLEQKIVSFWSQKEYKRLYCIEWPLVLLGQTGKCPHLSIHWLASNTGTQSSPIRSDAKYKIWNNHIRSVQ